MKYSSLQEPFFLNLIPHTHTHTHTKTIMFAYSRWFHIRRVALTAIENNPFTASYRPSWIEVEYLQVIVNKLNNSLLQTINSTYSTYR